MFENILCKKRHVTQKYLELLKIKVENIDQVNMNQN